MLLEQFFYMGITCGVLGQLPLPTTANTNNNTGDDDLTDDMLHTILE